MLTSDGAIDYVAYSSLPKLKGDQIFLGTLNMSLILLFKLKTRISANLLIAVKWCVKDLSQSGIVAQARSMLAWHGKTRFVLDAATKQLWRGVAN